MPNTAAAKVIAWLRRTDLYANTASWPNRRSLKQRMPTVSLKWNRSVLGWQALTHVEAMSTAFFLTGRGMPHCWQVLNFVQQILAGREAHVVDSWGKPAALSPEGECSLQRCGPTGQNGERDTISGASSRELERVGVCTSGLSVPDERGCTGRCRPRDLCVRQNTSEHNGHKRLPATLNIKS